MQRRLKVAQYIIVLNGWTSAFKKTDFIEISHRDLQELFGHDTKIDDDMAKNINRVLNSADSVDYLFRYESILRLIIYHHVFKTISHPYYKKIGYIISAALEQTAQDYFDIENKSCNINCCFDPFGKEVSWYIQFFTPMHVKYILGEKLYGDVDHLYLMVDAEHTGVYYDYPQYIKNIVIARLVARNAITHPDILVFIKHLCDGLALK